MELRDDARRELRLRPGVHVYVVVKSHIITVTSLKKREHHEE